MYIPCFVAKLTPWWGVVLYLAFGVAWVFAGDALLAQWAGTPEQIAHFQTWKGWAYVLFTSALAGWLLARMRKVERQRSAVARELAPHMIAFYLKDLAGEFHGWYNAERMLVDDVALRDARVALAAAVRQTIRNGMAILGVSCPESM